MTWDEIAARTAALTTAPAGCAFLRAVELLGLSAAAAADPVRSFDLLGQALTDVSVWRSDHAIAVQQILAVGPRLAPSARAILARPEAAWWFGPLDRQAQLSAVNPTGTTLPTPPIVPAGPPSAWERYAQKPFWGLYTSTEIAGTSSFLTGAAAYAGDLGPFVYPVERYRFTVSAAARVFTVNGPAAWHRLCATYAAPEPGGLLGDLLVPDFAAVAREWDAVHLTLGGLLAADQVRVDGPAGSSELQGWNAEQTVWLRWVFDDVTRLPDLLAPATNGDMPWPTQTSPGSTAGARRPGRTAPPAKPSRPGAIRGSAGGATGDARRAGPSCRCVAYN